MRRNGSVCAKSLSKRRVRRYGEAWFNLGTMLNQTSPQLLKPIEPHELMRALGATALLIAIFFFFVLAAPHDPAKLVAGAPCSVLSETEISLVIGTPVRLMPTSGSICEYVSTGGEAQRTLFVVAKSDPAPPYGWPARAVSVRDLGNAALRRDASLYVRFGNRAYIVTLVPQNSGTTGVFERERRLARMLGRSVIARNK